ncbi:hypothetical protein BCR43DRAFT_509307 [Syncephalastrum racemosum]|uniref:Uncharacterized protein n=1 Tax=Syncephalastrum racemosum TaxID=13706 RepID=A0A1X2GYU7_SYNRA|nr:hypothetical protein BCR43DRAFT_509307 [Syncephalastrum racemosum]
MCLSMRLYPSAPAPCITLRTRKIKTNRPPRHTSKQCCRSDAPLLVRLSIAIRMPYNVNLEKRRNYHAEILIPVFAITSRYKLLYAKWPIPRARFASPIQIRTRTAVEFFEAVRMQTREYSVLVIFSII